MKLQIKTEVFKNLITKASKAATNNKMIPLTGLMHIELKDGVLSITTSDAVNFFTLKEPNIEGDNFSVVVLVDLFSKLVAKTTSETITLDYTDNKLSFTGNGTYNIDLPLDEEGRPITYPTYDTSFTECQTGIIKLSTVKSIILANKPALAVSMEVPYLTGYYCDKDKVVSADSFNICINKVETFPESVLISPIVFELLTLSDSEDISYEFTETAIIFKTPKITLYTRNMKGKEDYPIDAVTSYIDNEFPSKCVLPKTALINVFDRLSLFISNFDINGVVLNFTNEGVKVCSVNGSGYELIPYQGSENFAPYSCKVVVDATKKQIAARSGEIINICYGINGALKFVDNNVIQIIALMEDEEDEEDEVVTTTAEEVE